MKEFYKATGILKEPFREDFVLGLWELDAREYQYAALDYIKKLLKKLSKNELPLMEKLIKPNPGGIQWTCLPNIL